MQIRVAKPGTADWAAAIDIVRDKYRRAFQAQVQPHPDRFVVCFQQPQDDGAAKAVACAGITFGGMRTMFSERYLDDAAHTTIEKIEGRAVPRDSIVEVGALASAGFRAGAELVRIVPLLCWCMGKRYVLCTATRPLRALFENVGTVFNSICPADPERLDPRDRDTWGNYYQQDPYTGYISLAEMMGQLARHTGRYNFDNPIVDLADPTCHDEPDLVPA